jgi:hypothetical protein
MKARAMISLSGLPPFVVVSHVVLNFGKNAFS